MTEEPPRSEGERTDRAMDRLEALADMWAVEVDLPAMIRNVVNVARLNRRTPDNVREKFIARAEAQMDAIIRQAFMEGTYRGFTAGRDYSAAKADGA